MIEPSIGYRLNQLILNPFLHHRKFIAFSSTGLYFNVFFSFRVDISAPKGTFTVLSPPSSGWTYIVLNYIGPNNGQGIRIYNDGIQTGSDDTKSGGAHPPGEGRILVGRPFLHSDEFYASFTLDELIFFNRALTMEEIKALGNVV